MDGRLLEERAHRLASLAAQVIQRVLVEGTELARLPACRMQA